jgi:hypothetical protein
VLTGSRWDVVNRHADFIVPSGPMSRISNLCPGASCFSDAAFVAGRKVYHRLNTPDCEGGV